MDVTAPSDADLLNLQLEIARRADELARARGSRGVSDDRDCWLEAENEVLRRAAEPAFA